LGEWHRHGESNPDYADENRMS